MRSPNDALFPKDAFKMLARLIVRAETVKELNQGQSAIGKQLLVFHAANLHEAVTYVKCIIPYFLGFQAHRETDSG